MGMLIHCLLNTRACAVDLQDEERVRPSLDMSLLLACHECIVISLSEPDISASCLPV